VANPVSHLTTANKVVWSRTSIEVNPLSRILLRISLAKPKEKSKKMSSIDPVEEEEKAEVEVEAEPRSKKVRRKPWEGFTQGHQRYTPTTMQCCYPW
jgi:hypothetical protein